MFVRLVRGAFDRFPRFDVASRIYPPFEPGRYVCVKRKELANWLSARSMPGVFTLILVLSFRLRENCGGNFFFVIHRLEGGCSSFERL